MADDDIDIDIYGDDRPATAVDENFELDLDEPQDGPPVDEVLPNAPSEHHNSSQSQTPTPNVSTVRTPAHHGHQDQITAQNRLPGATALRMNELYWWVNEDTVRSWINASQLETEVVEIAFAEHRENGKSKGEVWIRLTTPQATSDLRRHLMTEQDLSKYFKTQFIAFANGEYNPYRSISHSPQKQYTTRHGQPNQLTTRGRGALRPRVVMVDPGRGGFQRPVGYNSIRASDQDAWGHGPSMSMPGGSMMMNMGAMMPMMGMNMGNFGGFMNPQYQGANMHGGTPHGVKRPRHDS